MFYPKEDQTAAFLSFSPPTSPSCSAAPVL